MWLSIVLWNCVLRMCGAVFLVLWWEKSKFIGLLMVVKHICSAHMHMSVREQCSKYMYVLSFYSLGEG